MPEIKREPKPIKPYAQWPLVGKVAIWSAVGSVAIVTVTGSVAIAWSMIDGIAG